MDDETPIIIDILREHGYEYKKMLGKGAFSSVILCLSLRYNQEFAVKRSKKHKLTVSEYNTLISLNHPNIVKIYDAFEDESSQYLVMEYCPNGTIRQKEKLTTDAFIHYAKQILSALSYCHSINIVHRDIKPDNIFLDQYNNIKLADFGLSKEFENGQKSDQRCGTMIFFAPEIFQSQSFDPFKADVWALGITFFYMITGTYPFQNVDKEELKSLILYGELDFSDYAIDPQIHFLISKMTTKNPSARPSIKKVLKFPIFSVTNSRRRSLNSVILTPGLYTEPVSAPQDKGSNDKGTSPRKPLTLMNSGSFRFSKQNHRVIPISPLTF